MFARSQELRTKGVLLVPLPPPKVARGRELFEHYLANIPEHEEGAIFDGDYGAGSFGAINLASAYHNPAAVYIDEFVTEAMETIMTPLGSLQGLAYWECVPDRLCSRSKKQNPESWHTDNSAFASDPEDIFFGTIVNLNEDIDQVFTCVPGSHTIGARMKGGEYTPEGDSALWKEQEVAIKIPPNHALLFFENIVHRISGKTPKQPLLRKTVGFRLSNDESDWCPENAARMETQAALAHKGGEIAPLFPRLWLVNWPGKIEEYSKRLRPEMLTAHTYKTGKKRGRTIVTPHKIAPSLEELGFKYEQTESAAKRYKRRSVYG